MLPAAVAPDPTAVLLRRFVAFVIDALIGATPAFLLFVALAETAPREVGFFRLTCADMRAEYAVSLCGTFGDEIRYVHGGRALFVILAAVGVSLVNTVLLQAASASIGKRLVGLAVVRQDTGAPIGPAKALVRWLVSIVDFGCCFLIGGITVLVTKGHRRLGDMAAQSLVVDRRDLGRPPVVPGLTTSAPTPSWPPPAPAAPAPSWPPPAPAAPAPPAPPAYGPADAARATPGVPQWDPARGAYLVSEAQTGRLLQFDDTTQEWRPLG